MLNLLRIAFMCLLTLAVPVQGFAAATTLLCAGGHHHRMQSGAKAAHAHHHEHASQHGHEGSASYKMAGKCAACSACCTSVALLPTQAIHVEPLKATSDLVVVERRALALFLTDGPDRPPRRFLA
jgi:hypothetical protein